MRGHVDRHAHPRRRFITRRYCFQKNFSVRSPKLAGGQSRRDYGHAGVKLGFTVQIVKDKDVGKDAVRERGGGRVGPEIPADDHTGPVSRSRFGGAQVNARLLGSQSPQRAAYVIKQAELQ